MLLLLLLLPPSLWLLFFSSFFRFTPLTRAYDSYSILLCFILEQSLFGSTNMWMEKMLLKLSKWSDFAMLSLTIDSIPFQHIRIIIGCGFHASISFPFSWRKNKFSSNLGNGWVFSHETNTYSVMEVESFKKKKNEFSFNYKMKIDWFTVTVNQKSLRFSREYALLKSLSSFVVVFAWLLIIRLHTKNAWFFIFRG